MKYIEGTKIIDLTGQHFGLLTVKEFDCMDERGYGARWFCDCECGTRHKSMLASVLKRKSRPAKSCGCINEENKKNFADIQKIRMQKIKQEYFNTYKIADNVVVGFDSTSGKRFYVDAEDFGRVKSFHWSINSDDYVYASINDEKVYMHRYIMDCCKNDGIICDHIDGNRRDCRKNNLRKADRFVNSWNTKCVRNNSTGLKGVSFHNNAYEVGICFKGKNYYLGRFKTLDEALDARIAKEIELYPAYRRKYEVEE